MVHDVIYNIKTRTHKPLISISTVPPGMFAKMDKKFGYKKVRTLQVPFYYAVQG